MAAGAGEDIGPIPPGPYHIVDRQSGGRMGWLHDLQDACGWGTTDGTRWVAVMHPRTECDTVMTVSSVSISGRTR